jgi:hypothetical protein
MNYYEQGCHASGRPDASDDSWTSNGQHAVCHSPGGRASGGRHGGQPFDQRSPAPTNSWKADGRSIRPAVRHPDRWSDGRSPCCPPKPIAGWRGCPLADGMADASVRTRPNRRLWMWFSLRTSKVTTLIMRMCEIVLKKIDHIDYKIIMFQVKKWTLWTPYKTWSTNFDSSRLKSLHCTKWAFLRSCCKLELKIHWKFINSKNLHFYSLKKL